MENSFSIVEGECFYSGRRTKNKITVLLYGKNEDEGVFGTLSLYVHPDYEQFAYPALEEADTHTDFRESILTFISFCKRKIASLRSAK